MSPTELSISPRKRCLCVFAMTTRRCFRRAIRSPPCLLFGLSRLIGKFSTRVSVASDARKKSMPGFLRDRRNPAVNYLATRKAKRNDLFNLIVFDENVVKDYSLVYEVGIYRGKNTIDSVVTGTV